MPGDQKIRTAYARSETEFCVAIHRMEKDNMGTIILSYKGGYSQPWTGTYVPRNISSITDYTAPGKDPIYIAMSNEGDIYELHENKTKITKIKGAGVYSDDAKDNLGYVVDLKQIGSALYAVGQGAQLYKRDNGKDWVKIEDESFAFPAGYKDTKFENIDGPSEDCLVIYAKDFPASVSSKEIGELEKQKEAAFEKDDMDEYEKLFYAQRKLEGQIREDPQGRVLYFDGTEWDEMDVDGLCPGVIMSNGPDEIWGGATSASFLYGDVENGIDSEDIHDGKGSYYATTKFRDRYVLGSSHNIVSVKQVPDSMEIDVVPLKPKIFKDHPFAPLKVQAVDDVMFYFDYNLGIYIWDGDKKWTNIPIPPELLERDFKGLKP